MAADTGTTGTGLGRLAMNNGHRKQHDTFAPHLHRWLGGDCRRRPGARNERTVRRRAGERAGRRDRSQCLGCDQARRYLRDPHRAFGDGAGHADGAGAAGRRRTGMRLEQSHDRRHHAGRAISPANGPGAKWAPAAAAASAPRRIMSDAAARRRASCCCKPPAEQWNVPVGELTVSEGVITHASSNRSIRYGEVAAAAAQADAAGPKPSS